MGINLQESCIQIVKNIVDQIVFASLSVPSSHIHELYPLMGSLQALVPPVKGFCMHKKNTKPQQHRWKLIPFSQHHLMVLFDIKRVKSGIKLRSISFLSSTHEITHQFPLNIQGTFPSWLVSYPTSLPPNNGWSLSPHVEDWVITIGGKFPKELTES